MGTLFAAIVISGVWIFERRVTMLRFVSALGLTVLFAGGAYAGVPKEINHQGVV